MADFSRETREHWLKQHFSKNEVAKSGYTISGTALPWLSIGFRINAEQALNWDDEVKVIAVRHGRRKFPCIHENRPPDFATSSVRFSAERGRNPQ